MHLSFARSFSRSASLVLALAALASASSAHAQHWERWATGLSPGTYPVLAIAPAPARDVYYSFLLPSTGTGRVWRARIDSASPAFTLMPSFPLPTPTAGMTAPNVNSITTNRRGEPIVGLSIQRSDNTDPLIMSWDEAGGRWIAAPVRPSTSVCAHSIYRVDRAPNGDIWAICQWHGAYRSTDDGRSFDYVDISALLHTTHPAYFPTRSGNVDNLGAIYSIAFDAAGTIFIGTETGGEVMSSDGGATWHPLDADSTNPMSTMARATNSGDDYGTGVTASGLVVFHGFPGMGAYPTPDAPRLYVADRVAHTVTTARGVPDYWIGGRLQFASLPTGEIFFHSNHDTVSMTTGAPQPGGIWMSTNGTDWAAMNTGIDETSMIPGMSVWIDGNGRGASGGFALDGSTLYTVTQRGNVYRFVPAGGGGTDAGTIADAGSASDAGTVADAGAIDAGAGIDAGSANDASATDGGTTSDAAAPGADGAAAIDAARIDGGSGASTPASCGCRAAGAGRSRAGLFATIAIGLLVTARRRRTRRHA